ncbi:Iron-sulfur assembly protein 2 [Fusarium oxysporum f. sp. albedinis]|nr:Iron-sulfur assembly protein 2 [Fusarium oxysporum f. sp. albedinis]
MIRGSTASYGSRSFTLPKRMETFVKRCSSRSSSINVIGLFETLLASLKAQDTHMSAKKDLTLSKLTFSTSS